MAMSTDARALLREVLSLPDDERADIAAELLASLEDTSTDDPIAVRDMWSQEIDRRAQRVLAGESVGEDWSDLRQRVTDKLAGG
jgi:hypothetical protein